MKGDTMVFSKSQLVVTTAIDLTFFLIVVFGAGKLLARVEALELNTVRREEIAELRVSKDTFDDRLDRIEDKLDVLLGERRKN